MFIGRKNELARLEKLYSSDKFEFLVVYGRRRVGKTTLLSEFVKDKPHIFFVSQEYDEKTALQIFSRKIFEHFGLYGSASFDNWVTAFDSLAQKIQEQRLVLVIDEFPYLANANRSIPSIIQNVIDHSFLQSKLFLIICGSSLSFMEKEVLSAKSPLYGRRTSQMKIEPFTFIESCSFVPSYNAEDKVSVYGITGGIPQYLGRFSDKRPLRENVIEEVLSKTSFLYEEPRNLLKQELREPMVYNSIIEAIAKGSSRLNDIATGTNLPTDKSAKYISSLINLQILNKEIPTGEIGTRKSIYKITDNFFKFWYRFVFDHIELVEQSEGEFLYDNIISPGISDYIGKFVFEDICIQYMRRQNSFRKLPIMFTKIGRWWGNNPIEKRQMEIDILAFHGKDAIFGECKWRNEPVDIQIFEKLAEKSKSFSKYSNKNYILFSKNGFTNGLKKTSNTSLVDLTILADEAIYTQPAF